MTNKIQKIREEVERKLDVMQYQVHRKDAYKELKSILDYIDSLQEEPVSEDLKEAAIAYNKKVNFVVAGNVPNEHFVAGAQWQKENLWRDAQGDNLPDIDREVIALTQPYPDDEHLRVVFAHRPSKYTKVWNYDLGEEQVVEVERYGKGGWNIPNIMYWLDVEFPKAMKMSKEEPSYITKKVGSCTATTRIIKKGEKI